jgi:hypothetical protein
MAEAGDWGVEEAEWVEGLESKNGIVSIPLKDLMDGNIGEILFW